MAPLHPITTCLWFDNQAEEAVKFYTGLFEDGQVSQITRYGKEGKDIHGMAEGSVMTMAFEIGGQRFTALNAGPHFTFNPSVSFFIVCETEKELATLWSALSERGTVLMPLDKYDWSERYGWVNDRFGLSWQVALGKLEDVGQKITPSLLFVGDQAGRAEEAIKLYTSVFKDAEVVGILKNTAVDDGVEGTVKHAQFTLNGQVFMAMDSSLEHDFSFNEAISFVVNCKTQEEVDYYWEMLSEGGEEGPCGWLKDRFGLSWQVVPVMLAEAMRDAGKAEKITKAFMQMKKLDIKRLEAAIA
ncbi:VOC family protein [Negadavirga shengliensis]|uniref:VOC family protein n=1 Tax=Negadavirga shengliensis TaxID=1389218 RepID=A0ABV9SWJ0_9BACT